MAACSVDHPLCCVLTSRLLVILPIAGHALHCHQEVLDKGSHLCGHQLMPLPAIKHPSNCSCSPQALHLYQEVLDKGLRWGPDITFVMLRASLDMGAAGVSGQLTSSPAAAACGAVSHAPCRRSLWRTGWLRGWDVTPGLECPRCWPSGCCELSPVAG